MTDHFRDESFQAIDSTGTDNQKQRNKTTHTHETQKYKHKKITLAKNTKTTKPSLSRIL